ncbi:hypothetical protein GEP10_23345 [Salmonella enterica subsp. enterica serovar Anatum]|nr:hypothetical protein [Salmonella enterica subsp. enterica serovar Anatum]
MFNDSATPGFSTTYLPDALPIFTMRGHAIMRQTKALIEAQGYNVIYGDTDSTFVWLRRAHSEADAAEIGHRRVRDRKSPRLVA